MTNPPNYGNTPGDQPGHGEQQPPGGSPNPPHAGESSQPGYGVPTPGQGYGPPASGGSGYGPPPAGPGGPGSYQPYPGEPKKSHTGLIIGIVIAAAVVVIAAVIGIVFWANSGSNDSNDTAGSPKEAITQFMKAAKANDVSKAKSLVCKQDRGSLENAAGFRTGRVDYSIGAEKKISNTDYRYPVKITANGSSVTVALEVIKEDGGWVVCPSKSSFGGDTTTPGGRDLPTSLPSDFENQYSDLITTGP